MIAQLKHPLHVFVTSKNSEGRVLGWIVPSLESGLYWIVALSNREIWVTKNEEIRMLENWTLEYR